MSRIKMKFDRPKINLSTDGRILGFTKQEKEDHTIINVQGVCGDDWDGFTAGQMVDEIQRIDTDIVLRLNTPGGYVTEALDIYMALIDHPHNVRADIVAEAWSAGTIITSAADEVRISPAAKYGVHRAWSGFVIMGNAEEILSQVNQLESYAEHLEKLDDQIAEIIAQRSGLDSAEVLEWMIGPEGVDGTEFIGQEAVNAGLADSLIELKTKKKPAKDAKAEYLREAQVRAIKIARMRTA